MTERAAFEARLRAIGAKRYHDLHPFNLRMHAGELSREEIQTWVRNRYYYQTRIPIKDSLIISKARDPEFRRDWVQRIHDHDGRRAGEGGLELWLQLADCVGLERSEVAGLEHVLPGVCDACDDYVRFVEEHDLLESVAASLTELFAGDIMKVRLEAFAKHYPWVATQGLHYFRSRTEQAPRDAAWGLGYVLDHGLTEEDRERCARALERKCDILWRILDAVQEAHERPRLTAFAQLREGKEGAATVVVPERAVELNASSREILALCDGERTALEVASELARRHPNAAAAESDAHQFVAQMRRLGVLEAPAP